MKKRGYVKILFGLLFCFSLLIVFYAVISSEKVVDVDGFELEEEELGRKYPIDKYYTEEELLRRDAEIKELLDRKKAKIRDRLRE